MHELEAWLCRLIEATGLIYRNIGRVDVLLANQHDTPSAVLVIVCRAACLHGDERRKPCIHRGWRESYFWTQ